MIHALAEAGRSTRSVAGSDKKTKNLGFKISRYQPPD